MAAEHSGSHQVPGPTVYVHCTPHTGAEDRQQKWKWTMQRILVIVKQTIVKPNTRCCFRIFWIEASVASRAHSGHVSTHLVGNGRHTPDPPIRPPPPPRLVGQHHHPPPHRWSMAGPPMTQHSPCIRVLLLHSARMGGVGPHGPSHTHCLA